MIRSALFTVSLAALALAGCGKKAEPVDQGSPSSTAAAEATVANAATPDQNFVDAAAASDAFEIETSKLAEAKATAAPIKKFAAMMIKAHTDSTAKLKAAAAQATPAVTPAAQLTPTQQQTLAALGAKSGADFDRAYAQAQVEAHQMTLDTLKAYSAGGNTPSLKALASELIPVVTAHLNMAKAL